jgi:hypothetical protein
MLTLLVKFLLRKVIIGLINTYIFLNIAGKNITLKSNNIYFTVFLQQLVSKIFVRILPILLYEYKQQSGTVFLPRLFANQVSWIPE